MPRNDEGTEYRIGLLQKCRNDLLLQQLFLRYMKM